MQVCTLLQTDNHTSTLPLSFLQAGCPSCRPTNSVKALKAQSNIQYTKNVYCTRHTYQTNADVRACSYPTQHQTEEPKHAKSASTSIRQQLITDDNMVVNTGHHNHWMTQGHSCEKTASDLVDTSSHALSAMVRHSVWNILQQIVLYHRNV